MRHTPAPWRCSHIKTEEAPNNLVHTFEVYTSPNVEHSNEIGLANAHLIAQVPEMRKLLDECDTIFHIISLSGNHFKLTPQIERAINETWPKIGKALEKPTSKP